MSASSAVQVMPSTFEGFLHHNVKIEISSVPESVLEPDSTTCESSAIYMGTANSIVHPLKESALFYVLHLMCCSHGLSPVSNLPLRGKVIELVVMRQLPTIFG